MMDTNPVWQDIFPRILIVSGQAALLALLIVALQRLLRGWLSPAWRHALWSLLLVRLMLLWSVPTSLSVFTVLCHAGRELRNAITAPVTQAAAAGYPTVTALPMDEAALSPLQWAFALWCCGVVLTLGLAVIQACRLGRQARNRARVTDPEVLAVLDICRQQMGIRRDIPILRGPDDSVPALLGFLRPRLLVPGSLLVPEARAGLRYVLLHELAHIRRQDVLTGWLAHLVLSLHWFNPVLWWARRRCADDRELACDARVLSLLTPKERRAYGHALLDQFRAAAAPLSSPGLVGVLEGTSSIERRIEMITSFDRSPRKGTLPALLAVMLLTVTALTGEEEAALANQPAAAVTAPSAVSEPRVLLAMGQPKAEEPAISSAINETQAVAPQTPSVAEAKDVEKTTAAKIKPTRKDRARTAAAKSAGKPAVIAKASAPQPASPENAEPQETPAPATDTRKADCNAPATLHSAINKAAADYAQSLEVKSTRPGEDPPFTITVSGSVQVRAESWSNMPKSGGTGPARTSGVTPSMRTRVKLCADFGQTQCTVEGSSYEGGSRLFSPRDAD